MMGVFEAVVRCFGSGEWLRCLQKCVESCCEAVERVLVLLSVASDNEMCAEGLWKRVQIMAEPVVVWG